ncbi:protein FAM124B isoform X2 [Varanus komodoensis]|uniref:protein FAM124B isoform X2 n=1 Tax=Varanus komodoensis TaxID=61221 RepID=UPI001CF776BE|nr:protein FAM124B isoform X2 [Varanus komodoensis]XP_044288939.1 protein FAM124B isoform X2 [Varanus komodoensis]
MLIQKLHCCGLVVFAVSHRIMDGRTDSLVMTVHLLARSGHALLLQKTLDQLQEWICLDLRLFLVSERTSPMKYYETHRQKSARFPGTSVLLFLHEDFGEERIFQVHGFFQHPPWQRVHIESAKKGQLSPYALQDFYGLDEHMPVWGLRQVHYGTEILRVTLYCSFDNYEDAVRLYEMILQREAAVQKSSFCAFVLYTTQSIAVQLCLKQLPLGVCVDSKESSVLQFKVHEIGQLVPLLPNPCVPISSTRWQTEDYEGNKILLQVQGSSKHNGDRVSSSSCHHSAPENSAPISCSSPSPVATTRTVVQQKTRTLRAMKNKNKSTRGMAHAPGSLGSPSQSNFCSSSQPCSPAGSSLQDLSSSQVNLGTKWRYSSHELWLSQEEEETNVDTGNRVASSECSNSPLNRFSKDLQNGLFQPQAPCCSFTGAHSKIHLHSENRSTPSLHIAKSCTEVEQRQSSFHLRTSGASHGEEEEFFI